MKTYGLENGKWRLRAVGDSHWLPVSIPGEVHVALMDAGRIPDPFVEDNELEVLWVAQTDWEFEGRLDVPDELLTMDRVRLCFDGLDTLAQVFLNDSPLGKTNNAFRTYSWEVKDLLQKGENRLRIRFDSPVETVSELQKHKPLVSPGASIPGAHTYAKPLANGVGIGGPNSRQLASGRMLDWKGSGLQNFSQPICVKIIFTTAR